MYIPWSYFQVFEALAHFLYIMEKNFALSHVWIFIFLSLSAEIQPSQNKLESFARACHAYLHIVPFIQIV